jgi:hypothetical protein
MVEVLSDVGAVAKAAQEALELLNQLADPTNQDRKFLKSKLKALYKVRNIAHEIFNITDAYFNKYQDNRKILKCYRNLREDFDKAIKKT